MEAETKLNCCEALDISMDLLTRGRALDADAILTTALIGDGRNPQLWMAAGIARTMRGQVGPAKQAFRMCAWISGDPVARELAEEQGCRRY